MKNKLLFVITQFYKGGAETALLNLFHSLSPEDCDVDFLIFDQISLPTAVSLVDSLPPWINVCNAAEREGVWAWIKKFFFRVWRKLTKRQLYRRKAAGFVRGKRYDVAFSYGEWMSPEFVAQQVTAEKKAVWTHTDIDKSYFIDEKILFGYESAYQYYIFVSRKSMEGAIVKYPFLAEKARLIHNMCSDEEVRRRSCEPLKHAFTCDMIVTVANIRPEKNHLRQVEAMRIMKDRGLTFTWVNIGSTANVILHGAILRAVAQYGLEDRFVFVGVDENPYRYIRQARAVAVLSDYESWSMVITEAKVLGVPVVATKTSGAVEQIADGVTGLLADFTAEDIAEKLAVILTDDARRDAMSHNLSGFTTRKKTLGEFFSLIHE